MPRAKHLCDSTVGGGACEAAALAMGDRYHQCFPDVGRNSEWGLSCPAVRLVTSLGHVQAG